MNIDFIEPVVKCSNVQPLGTFFRVWNKMNETPKPLISVSTVATWHWYPGGHLLRMHRIWRGTPHAEIWAVTTCDMRRCCPKYIIYRGRTDRMHWADINKRIQKVMLRVANLPKMSFVSGYVGDVWALFQRPLYRMIHRIQEESMLPFLGKNRWKQTWPTGIWVTPTDLIPSGGI